MAQNFQLFRGNTEEELFKIRAGTPEGMLLKMLLSGNKGFLVDSHGALVREDSIDPVKGIYRFFAAKAGERVPWESVQHIGCIKQDSGVWRKAGGGRPTCCLMSTHLQHPQACVHVVLHDGPVSTWSMVTASSTMGMHPQRQQQASTTAGRWNVKFNLCMQGLIVARSLG